MSNKKRTDMRVATRLIHIHGPRLVWPKAKVAKAAKDQTSGARLP